jgi:N-acetylmuramoyl-L-alanine amidase
MQFSCWNLSDPNRKVILAKTLPEALDDGWFLDCLSAALDVIRGFEPDPTCGSTHYHTAAVAPARSRGKVPVCRIGSHKFFNDID